MKSFEFTTDECVKILIGLTGFDIALCKNILKPTDEEHQQADVKMLEVNHKVEKLIWDKLGDSISESELSSMLAIYMITFEKWLAAVEDLLFKHSPKSSEELLN